MRPVIEGTAFGSITIDGKPYTHDIYILSNGEIKKRKKKLSKKIYGTSHKVSRDEIEYILDDKCEMILIGSGQYGRLKLSDPAAELLAIRMVKVDLHPTPDAIQLWNQHEEISFGLFHVTC